MPQTDVLIVGAGPTGLVLALWLTRLGVRVRIIDKSTESGTTSRALGVQARTLEFYQQLGIADDVIASGRRVTGANFWARKHQLARVAIGNVGAGSSPFPFLLIFPQDEHETLLLGRLAERGVTVERQTALTGFRDTGDRVVATLQMPDGQTETCEAQYIAGCDGARSTVRETLGIGFGGGTYEHTFYVADVNASGPAINGDIHVAFNVTDFIAVFPLKSTTRARIVGAVKVGATPNANGLTWDDVS